MTSETPTEARTVAPRRGTRPFVIGGSIAAVLFATFAALGAARAGESTLAFDSLVISVVHGMRATWLTPVMVLGTELGTFPVAAIVAAALVVYLLAKRLWTAAALVVAVYGIGFFWGSLAQELIRRVRPPQIDAIIPVPTAYSYPSGHSITAMLLYGAIAFLAFRVSWQLWARVTVAAVCVVLIVLVGFTRVYLGAHWPTDVIGAWLLGGAWLALIAGVYMALQKRVAES